MITKISVKGIAVPPPFGFHDVEWESPEEVLEGSSYANGVTLDPRETGCYGCFQNPGGEGLLGHWRHCSLVVWVTEEMKTGGGVIDFEVQLHGFLRVTGTILLGPVEIFSFDSASFSYWNLDSSCLQTSFVNAYAQVQPFRVYLGVEGG